MVSTKEETSIQKPLIEQIFDEMFINIEKQDEFDEQIIQELKELALSGKLNKSQQIIEAIKLASEELDATN